MSQGLMQPTLALSYVPMDDLLLGVLGFGFVLEPSLAWNSQKSCLCQLRAELESMGRCAQSFFFFFF